MNLENLTSEERKELMAQLAEEQKKEYAAKREREQDYKKLVDETVLETLRYLKKVSADLALAKKHVYNEFGAILDLKGEFYPKTADNDSHTFTTSDGKHRITLGNNMIDNYDDTATDGINIVKAYINSLATDRTSKELVNAVLKLLARDNTGNLKASRVMQLEKIALESGNETFLEGVRIIKAAYNPIPSKQYVRAQYKGEQNEWINLPLGMTES